MVRWYPVLIEMPRRRRPVSIATRVVRASLALALAGLGLSLLW